MAAPILGAEEFQYRDNGELLNGDFVANISPIPPEVVARNEALNPSGQGVSSSGLNTFDTGEWYFSGASTSTWAVQQMSDSGGPFVRLERMETGGGTNNACTIWWTPPAGLPEADNISARVELRRSAPAEFTWRNNVTQLGAAQAAGTEWAVYKIEDVAPGGSSTRIGINIGGVPVGHYVDFRMPAWQFGPTAPPAFDGSTSDYIPSDPNELAIEYDWTGTANASASTMTTYRTGVTGVDRIVDITRVTGLDSPDIDSSTRTREGVDGGYINAQYETSRTVILDGTVYAPVDDLERYLDSLKANYAPSRVPLPFYFGTDRGMRVVYGKSLGFKYDKDTIRRIGTVNCQLQVVCEDPRIYSPQLITSQVFPSSAAQSGRGYDKSYDYGYGGQQETTNYLSIQLQGNRDQPGIIRVYGPMTDCEILNEDNGTSMVIDLVMSSDDFIEIDLDKRTVKLNGVSGRRGSMTLFGSWYLLSPGVNSFRIFGTGFVDGISRFTVQAHAAAWR